jgi:hypothetical protein
VQTPSFSQLPSLPKVIPQQTLVGSKVQSSPVVAAQDKNRIVSPVISQRPNWRESQVVRAPQVFPTQKVVPTQKIVPTQQVKSSVVNQILVNRP